MSDSSSSPGALREETFRLAELEPPPDPKLVAEGWERRFTVDGRRLKEFAALYASLGFEVHVVPLRPEEVDPDCGDCRLAALLQFSTIYTRRPVK